MTQMCVINGNGRVQLVPVAAAGAITWQGYKALRHFLKAGSAAALSIAAPTAVIDDGVAIEFIAQDAYAYVLTSPVDGFNAKGSSGTATWTAAIGNKLTLTACDGHWYATGAGVTIA